MRPIRRRQHTTLEAICPTSRDRSDPLLTARQIDSKKPPRYTAQHRVGLLPGGFLFPEWAAFFTGIRRQGAQIEAVASKDPRSSQHRHRFPRFLPLKDCSSVIIYSGMAVRETF